MRVYVRVVDAAGAIVACRYLSIDEVPSWLTVRAGSGSARCEVFDEAPACGGKLLTTFVPSGRTWREQS